MCPDRELNPWPFGPLDDAPTIWATAARAHCDFFELWIILKGIPIFHTYRDFSNCISVIDLWLNSNMVREHNLYNFNPLKLVLWFKIWSILINTLGIIFQICLLCQVR